MPLVSVVIPTYNHAGFLPATLRSVFGQTFTDYELIIIDDGSPDDTPAVLDRCLADRPGLAVRRLRQPNAGQAAARNRGIGLARGRYVALLDDDDLWPPDKLQWQVDAMQRDPAAVLVYGDHQPLMPDGKLRPPPDMHRPAGRVHRDFLLANRIHSPGQTLIRRDALDAAGGFDPAIWGSDDWDLYLRLARLGPFIHQPRSALHVRVHAANASRHAVRHARNHLKVVRKHMAWRAPLIVRHQRAAASYFVPNLLRCADHAADAGDRRLAARARAMTLLFQPTLLLRRSFLRGCMRLMRRNHEATKPQRKQQSTA